MPTFLYQCSHESLRYTQTPTKTHTHTSTHIPKHIPKHTHTLHPPFLSPISSFPVHASKHGQPFSYLIPQYPTITTIPTQAHKSTHVRTNLTSSHQIHILRQRSLLGTWFPTYYSITFVWGERTMRWQHTTLIFDNRAQNTGVTESRYGEIFIEFWSRYHGDFHLWLVQNRKLTKIHEPIHQKAISKSWNTEIQRKQITPLPPAYVPKFSGWTKFK